VQKKIGNIVRAIVKLIQAVLFEATDPVLRVLTGSSCPVPSTQGIIIVEFTVTNYKEKSRVICKLREIIIIVENFTAKFTDSVISRRKSEISKGF
jgi:hypothetical protein